VTPRDASDAAAKGQVLPTIASLVSKDARYEQTGAESGSKLQFGGRRQREDDKFNLTVSDLSVGVDEAINDISLVSKLGHDGFTQLLEHFNVPVREYGTGKAKHVTDLWLEMERGETKLGTPTTNGKRKLLRSVRAVVVELRAELQDPSREVFLLLKHMFTDSGAERRNLDMRVTRKMLIGEDQESAMWRCLMESFNLSQKVCKDSFVLESIKNLEEQKMSEGFPGLQTRYKLAVCRVTMKAPCLPTTAEFESIVAGKMGSGSKRVWMWCRRDYFESLFPYLLVD